MKLLNKIYLGTAASLVAVACLKPAKEHTKMFQNNSGEIISITPYGHEKGTKVEAVSEEIEPGFRVVHFKPVR